MKKLWIILGLVVFGLAACFVWINLDDEMIEEPVEEIILEDTNALFDILESSSFMPGIEFEIDEGYRIDDGSNPRIMDYEDGIVELAYEYQSNDLKNEPGQKGWVAFSEDGLLFENERQFAAGEHFGKGVLMPSGVYRRYHEELDGYVYSETSTDGESYVNDDGFRYDLNENDEGYMGVRTYFLDDEGGTVLLYNYDLEGEDGRQTILVRRAYSEPGDEGMNFVYEDDNVLEFVDEQGRQMSFADPHAIMLPDGRIRLIVMNQDPDGPMPPLGRTGTLYSFISDDGGREFDFESKIVAWDSFEEWEVRSLNDPKIMLFENGSYRVYVAAMISDPNADPEGDARDANKWIIVSVTSN